MWPAAVARPRRSARRVAGAVEYRQEMLRLFGIPESEIAETLRRRRGRGRRPRGAGDHDLPAPRRDRDRHALRARAQAASTTRFADVVRERHAGHAVLRRRLVGRRAGRRRCCARAGWHDRRRPSRARAGCWPARLTELAGLVGLRARRAGRLLQRGQGGAGGRRPGADRARTARCRSRSPRRWPTGRARALGADVGVGITGIAGPGRRDARTSRSGSSASAWRAARTAARLTRRLHLPGGRADVRDRSTTVAHAPAAAAAARRWTRRRRASA